jgi:AraC-like DNA-binding protein
MRTIQRLASGGGFAIDELRILRSTAAWTAPEPLATRQLVFVRRGVFRLRVDGWTGIADPLVAYVGPAGAEHSIAHRPGVEDVCTVITLAGRPALDGGFRALRPTGANWLAHRVLVARARAGAEEFELAERVAVLAGDLLHPLARRPEAIGASRAHLSRVFHRVTGETLTRFRNRMRVRLALDRIEAGETDLARLAMDLGFADHAHLTRTVRAETGVPPRRVRELLSTNLQAGKGVQPTH